MKNDNTGSAAVLERSEDKSGFGKSDAEKQEMMKKMEAAGRPGRRTKRWKLSWEIGRPR